MRKSKKRSRARLAFSSVGLIVGVFLLLWGSGIIAMLPGAGATVLSATRIQSEGIAVTTSIKNFPLLSEVTPGGVYQYDVDITNTGSLGWDNAWFCVRILKSTSTPVLIDHAQYPGKHYVGQCAEGTNKLQCRENIESPSPTGWDMHFRSIISGTTWWPVLDTEMGDQIFCLGMGELKGGESVSWDFKITVPPEKTDSYPVIATAGAMVHGRKSVISSKVDNLNVGTVSGTMTFSFAGAILSISALAGLLIKP